MIISNNCVSIRYHEFTRFPFLFATYDILTDYVDSGLKFFYFSLLFLLFVYVFYSFIFTFFYSSILTVLYCFMFAFLDVLCSSNLLFLVVFFLLFINNIIKRKVFRL